MSNQVIEAILRGTYEWPEYKSINHNLDESDVVLEMGTGIGYVSLQCAKVVGGGNVHTFEPSPETAALALKNFDLNNANIKLTQKVLLFENNVTKFYINRQFESSSLVKREGGEGEIEVECEEVNEVINRVNPTFLVMDIEGGEAELIPKMNLNGVKKISIEVHPHVIGDENVGKIVLHLLNQGFLISWASSANNVLFLFRPDFN